jgi:sulfide:quinone oxidoreductase
MRVVVLGAGISGHTAAAFLKKMLGRKHEVIVVSPSSYYQWIPSNIWVGVGRMRPEQVRFGLQRVYDRWGIDFRQAKAVRIHPEGDATSARPFVGVVYTDEKKMGQEENIAYDYLVNATGPRLNFEATEGLGPGGHSYSVCSTSHAVESWKGVQACIAKMEKGERQRFLVGTGHPTATCQ